MVALSKEMESLASRLKSHLYLYECTKPHAIASASLFKISTLHLMNYFWKLRGFLLIEQ